MREISSGLTTKQTRHTQRISSVVFSPIDPRTGTSQYLASGSYDRRITWEIERFAEEGYRPIVLQGEPTTLVLSLAYHPDGSRLAAGVGVYVEVFDLQTGEQVRRMRHSDYVYGLAWSPDGKWLAAGDADGNLIVWDPVTGQRGRTPGSGQLTNVINNLAWSPDSQLLAASYVPGFIAVYDFQSGELLGQGFQTRGVLGLDFSRDGRLLASGGASGRIRVWDIPGLRVAGEIDLGYRIDELDFSDDEGLNLLAVGGFDFTNGRLNLFEVLPEDPLYETYAEGDGEALALEFTMDGTLLAAQNNRVALRIFNDTSILAPPEAEFTSAAFGSDGEQTILTVGDDAGRIWLYAIKDEEVLALPASTPGEAAFELPAQVQALAISPGGEYLAASYCADSTSGPEVQLRPLCFKSVIQLWDLSKYRPLDLTLTDEEHDWIRALAFHPDGAHLVSGSFDGTLLVWDLENGQLVNTPSYRFPGGITSLAFSTDGKRLASGGSSRRLVLWDAANFQPIGESLRGAASEIVGLTFEPNGKAVYSGDAIGTILKWEVSPDAWIERSCLLAGRNMTSAELRLYLPDKEPGYKTCPDLLDVIQ